MTKFVIANPDIRIPITFEENVEWWMNTHGFSRPIAEQWVAYESPHLVPDELPDDSSTST